MIRLGQESICCRRRTFIPRPHKWVTTPPLPRHPFPLPSIYFTTLPLRRHHSCAPFSLCSFDCSSFFIAPSASLWGGGRGGGGVRHLYGNRCAADVSDGFVTCSAACSHSQQREYLPLSICLLTPGLLASLSSFFLLSCSRFTLYMAADRGEEQQRWGERGRRRERAVVCACVFFPACA